MRRTQIVQIRHITHQPALEQQLDRFIAQTIDIHRLATYEVDYTTHDLRWAMALIGTIVLCLTFVMCQLGATFGAVGDILERLTIGFTLREFDSRNLRNDLATLLDIDHIAQANIEQRYLLGIVQRGAFDRCTSQQHRRKIRHGCDRSRAAHLKRHTLQSGQSLLGLEFISHSPTGHLRGKAQLLLCLVAINLDHHTIGREWQLMTRLIPIGNKLGNLCRRTAYTCLTRDLEAPLTSHLQRLPMRSRRDALANHLVERAIQTTMSNDCRILLFERTCRRIARIGKELLTCLLSLGIQSIER